MRGVYSASGQGNRRKTAEVQVPTMTKAMAAKKLPKRIPHGPKPETLKIEEKMAGCCQEITREKEAV